MSLTNAAVQCPGKLPQFFQSLAQGQAPEQFTVQHLRDMGFASSNDRTLIPLLKALGFLSGDGIPTNRYLEYRDRSRSRSIMAQALREAYADLFVIRENPTEDDKDLIQGKFKSSHNATERMSEMMARTFFALLELADLNDPQPTATGTLNQKQPMPEPAPAPPPQQASPQIQIPAAPTLHYNIQIHLPATRDIEVFNAIFRSLRDHLLG